MSSELHRIDVTVDVVLFTLKDEQLHVVLTRRAKAPFKGVLALPGGYVHAQEDVDSLTAAARVLRAKAGLVAPYLEQLSTYADSTRDPRGWSVSIAYYALVPLELLDSAAPAEESVSLVDVAAVDDVELAFDHAQIVKDAVARLRNKSAYSTLPMYLAGAKFTLAELQRAYEIALDRKLETSNFRRWLKELDIVEEVPGMMRQGPHRAAQVFRVQRGKSLKLLDKTLQTGQPRSKPRD